MLFRSTSLNTPSANTSADAGISDGDTDGVCGQGGKVCAGVCGWSVERGGVTDSMMGRVAQPIYANSHYLCCCGKNNSAIGTLKARAIFSMLSSEMLRTPRSQWVMNVRCSPVSNARNSCDHPRSARKARIFAASISRAKPTGGE